MTRIATVLSIAVLAAWVTTAPATAAIHTVAPGETLWSIAQTDGLSPQALAAANGLTMNAHILADSTLTIPAGGGQLGPPASLGPAPSEPLGDDSAPLAAQPAVAGGYVVQPGDTLSALAVHFGVSATNIAATNGFTVAGVLPAGATLQVSGGPAPAASVPAPAAAAPAATPGFVSRSQIASVATANGVPASLAQAVAWQESGFNNGLVSSANARGVMQIIPSTWRFVQSNLANSLLDPLSPIGNVRGGVLLLHYLLQAGGGDPATAIAGYYQGLGSIRREGMLPETRRYVANVLALSQRFGGP